MSWAGLALRARAEPRKDNRYSAADRFSRRKQALGAEEKDGPLPARLPTSHMSTLQIDLGFRRLARDHGTHQSARCILEPQDAWKVESTIQLG
jgi:hypothetical protein